MDDRQHPQGQGGSTEVAQGGICISKRVVPHGRWYTTGRYYFPSARELNIGWPRRNAGGEISKSETERSENEHGALCGRLHHYRKFERMAGTGGQPRRS